MTSDPAEPPWQELSTRAVLRWRLQLWAAGLAVTVAVGGVTYLLVRRGTVGWSQLAAMVTAVAVAAAAFGWGWPVLLHRRWRYRLAPDALELERGVVVRRLSSVPYGRVQQVDIDRGPIDRLLGLSVARLLTASSGTDGTVPGLTPEVAESFRQTVLARAGRHDAV